jgi:hypothetical protein
MQDTTSSSSPAPSDGEELRLLYQVTTADLAFFKQQQWQVTNYALLIQAALVVIAFEFLKGPVEEWKRAVLWLLVLLTMTASWFILSNLQASIEARHNRLRRIRRRFGREFRLAWNVKKPSDDIHLILKTIIGFAGVVVTWLLLREWHGL